MPKTKLEVVAQAHRHLGLLSADETASADQDAYAGSILDALFAEMNLVQNMQFTWTVDETPDAAFLPLSGLLATEIAPHYGVASEPRSRAIMRLRAYAFTDDRTDSRDYDNDGTVSDEEADAAVRALYY